MGVRPQLPPTETTHEQAVAAQRNIRASIALLDWLATRSLTLATAGQTDLEAWLASAEATHREDAGNFARWAQETEADPLDFAAVKWSGRPGSSTPRPVPLPALFQLATNLPAALFPACLASTSASPSPGNAPAAATGPPTPPNLAAGDCERGHSDSWDI